MNLETQRINKILKKWGSMDDGDSHRTNLGSLRSPSGALVAGSICPACWNQSHLRKHCRKCKRTGKIIFKDSGKTRRKSTCKACSGGRRRAEPDEKVCYKCKGRGYYYVDWVVVNPATIRGSSSTTIYKVSRDVILVDQYLRQQHIEVLKLFGIMFRTHMKYASSKDQLIQYNRIRKMHGLKLVALSTMRGYLADHKNKMIEFIDGESSG